MSIGERTAACTGLVGLCWVGLSFAATAQGWPQWGGPQRNFMVEATGLADTWPAGGPTRLWSRALGDGHSSIVVDGDRLYTMYSRGDQEFVISLDRVTGRTIWDRANASPTTGLNLQVEDLNVRGPHSTPLVAGDLLLTIGLLSKLQAFDKRTGVVAWSHDLWREYGATRQERGYVCSPVAWRNLVILTVGGAGQAIMAFDLKTGAMVWKKQSFRLGFSSPIVITVDGQDQVVIASADHVSGLDPATGALLWQHPHPCGGFNIAPPLWGADNVLFISSAYECGSRALRLRQSGGKTTVTELWASTRLRVHHGTIIRLGDLVFGSSGTGGATPMTALNIKTGELAWQDRTFPKSTFVYADGKLVLLDEDGQLALVRVTPHGMTVIAKTSVLQRLSWTPPTLVGTNLYLRDQRTIVALDLK
jgi:outer membrane protein assembly factor BamB